MNRPPRDCRVAEWAELVGERVPQTEATLDADRRTRDAAEDSGGDEAH